MTGKATLTNGQIADHDAGKWYLLVSSQIWPEGELKAQLLRFN